MITRRRAFGGRDRLLGFAAQQEHRAWQGMANRKQTALCSEHCARIACLPEAARWLLRSAVPNVQLYSFFCNTGPACLHRV